MTSISLNDDRLIVSKLTYDTSNHFNSFISINFQFAYK